MIRECSQAVQEIGDDPSDGQRDHDGDHDSPEDCYRTEAHDFKSPFAQGIDDECVRVGVLMRLPSELVAW